MAATVGYPDDHSCILRMRPCSFHWHVVPSLILASAVLAIAPLDMIYARPRPAATAAYLFQVTVSISMYYAGYAMARAVRIRIVYPLNWYAWLVVNLRGVVSYAFFAVRVFLICAFEFMSLVFLMNDPVGTLKHMHPAHVLVMCAILCVAHIVVTASKLGLAAWECTTATSQ